MPTFATTTKEATQIWASPDGQRKIYEVSLDYEGKPVKAKTYSDAISTVGWSGTVETYEKTNKIGTIETFVKQPPKEGGYTGNSGRQGSSPTSPPGKSMNDPFTMYLSYAKDLAVASVHEGKFDDKLYESLLSAVEAGGAQLYAGRPGAEPTEQPKEPTLTKSVVDKVFEIPPDDQEELPWAGIKGEDG